MSPFGHSFFFNISDTIKTSAYHEHYSCRIVTQDLGLD
jgi:hypothetical protein